MNKLLRFRVLIFCIIQGVLCDASNILNSSTLSIINDVEIIKNNIRLEGFLPGILVKTVDGYKPIDELSIGEKLVSVDGDQEIVSIEKRICESYLQLLIDGEIINVAPYQQFYMIDQSLKCALDLELGDILAGGNSVQAIQIIDEQAVGYSLSTDQHSFFIYPNIYTHNLDIATISAAGGLIVGAIEISCPIAMLVGVVVPLTAFAVNYFWNRNSSVYECDQEDDNLSDAALALKNTETVRATRAYFDAKRKELNDVYQELLKLKNNLLICINPYSTSTAMFSSGFLSQCSLSQFNLVSLPDVSYEIPLSCVDKAKLMKVRDDELERLQQDIVDLHLILAFHVSEIIERRDRAQQEVWVVVDQVNAAVNQWNFDLYNISNSIAIEFYRNHFVWREMLDHLEAKINEVNFVLAYYKKIKQHFFVFQTTNLLILLDQQLAINDVSLKRMKVSRAIWLGNVEIVENLLRNRGYLSVQLVNQYKADAQKYCARKNGSRDAILNAKKKKDAIKAVLDKKMKDEKDKNSGGGPEKDPDDNDPLPVKNRNIMMHIFQNKEGHLLDTLENRELLRSLVRDAKNYLGTDMRNNIWYGKILQNGKQLWAWVRNNIIRDGGLNETPKMFNVRTGLCNEFSVKK